MGSSLARETLKLIPLGMRFFHHKSKARLCEFHDYRWPKAPASALHYVLGKKATATEDYPMRVRRSENSWLTTPRGIQYWEGRGGGRRPCHVRSRHARLSCLFHRSQGSSDSHTCRQTCQRVRYPCREQIAWRS